MPKNGTGKKIVRALRRQQYQAEHGLPPSPRPFDRPIGEGRINTYLARVMPIVEGNFPSPPKTRIAVARYARDIQGLRGLPTGHFAHCLETALANRHWSPPEREAKVWFCR
jgi:hypothetical protein